MPNHVFISHSDKDKTYAEMVLNALEGRGVKCWIAPRDIPPGGSYADALLTAIEECACFILIFTAHSNESAHVLREVERALKFRKNIMPIRFDDSPPSRSLDYLLATVHWLTVDTKSAKAAVAQVAGQIAACLPAMAPPPSPPMPAPVSQEAIRSLTTPTPAARRQLPMAKIAASVLLLAAIAGGLSLFLKRKSGPEFVGQPDVVQPASPAAVATPGAAPQPAASAPVESSAIASSTPADFDSKATLLSYFAAFEQRNAAAAYNLLSAKFKQRTSFVAFSKMFSSTRSMQLVDANSVNESRNATTLHVVFDEEDADYHHVRWQGPIEFVREASGWKIETMKDLKRTAAATFKTKLPVAANPSGTPPEQTWDRPHVYLQLARQSQTSTGNDLRTRLKNAGCAVAGIEVVTGNVDIPSESCELRYFTPADAAEAQKMAHDLEPFVGGTGIVAYIPEGVPHVSHARQYELWLSTNTP